MILYFLALEYVNIKRHGRHPFMGQKISMFWVTIKITRFLNIACLPFLKDFGTVNHWLKNSPKALRILMLSDSVLHSVNLLCVEELMMQINIWMALTETGKRCMPSHRSPRLF